MVSRNRKPSNTSAQLKSKPRKSPRNSPPPSPKPSAQLGRNKNTQNTPLTRIPKKRGPKPKVRPSEVLNRSRYLQWLLKECADEIDWEKLKAANTKTDVSEAFREIRMDAYWKEFHWRRSLILECVKDPDFPKVKQESQIRFLAESLGGDGAVELRRSRDICLEERNKLERRGRIIRCDPYIECTCGREGPAVHGYCPNCGAEIPSYLRSSFPRRIIV